MTRIGIIIGSTRPGRKGATVANWVHELASKRDDATYELVDLADFALPHLDEPIPAAMGEEYAAEHTKRWSEKVASYDGFVFVTPEYNHSTTGVLKNAIDYLYSEWHNKSAGFVGYGLYGGTRAVEHLRSVAAELHIADVRDQVALSLFNDFDENGGVTPGPYQEPTLTAMLDQIVAWAEALKPLREKVAGA
ncbi:NADPH-dependent FMN reductase [Actinokineospora sp. G85]|uniref:NADPH-dependent FMN reductase n=1 Tax=Actinokineospora sp. G85 TaxID=3406626 RepID=UPI003C77C6C4